MGRRTRATVAVRHAPVGAAVPPSGEDGWVMTPSRGGRGPSSVTLVPLLLPRVAAVVVAVLLPEAGLVPLHHRDPADPLGALAEVEGGHQPPHRPAVLGGQRLAVELPDDPGLATG